MYHFSCIGVVDWFVICACSLGTDSVCILFVILLFNHILFIELPLHIGFMGRKFDTIFMGGEFIHD